MAAAAVTLMVSTPRSQPNLLSPTPSARPPPLSEEDWSPKCHASSSEDGESEAGKTRGSEQTGAEAGHNCVRRFVRRQLFELLILCAIVANCVTTGIEAELLMGKSTEFWRDFVNVSEHVLTLLFLVEMVLRVYAFGWRFYLPFARWGGDPGNFLDGFLVLVTGVGVNWILPIFGVAEAGELKTLTALRAFRLVRLVRVVQHMEAFHEVWLLLRGLAESGRVLFWTMLVIFIITYVFATVGVMLIGTEIKELHDRDVAAKGVADPDLAFLLEVTDGVWALMFTLIQLLTLDSWTSFARPMQARVPGSWAFLYLYIAVAVVVMMNLVTAVIVENALKSSQKDAEQLADQRENQKQAELRHLKLVFERMDVDGDNELSWHEFETALEDQELRKSLLAHGITRKNCKQIFELLDTGDGVISMEEFFEGVTRLEGQASAADLFRTNKATELIVRMLVRQTKEMQEDFQTIMRQLQVEQRPNRSFSGDLMQRSSSSKRHAPARTLLCADRGTPRSGHTMSGTRSGTSSSNLMMRLAKQATFADSGSDIFVTQDIFDTNSVVECAIPEDRSSPLTARWGTTAARSRSPTSQMLKLPLGSKPVGSPAHLRHVATDFAKAPSALEPLAVPEDCPKAAMLPSAGAEASRAPTEASELPVLVRSDSPSFSPRVPVPPPGSASEVVLTVEAPDIDPRRRCLPMVPSVKAHSELPRGPISTRRRSQTGAALPKATSGAHEKVDSQVRDRSGSEVPHAI